MGTVYPTQTERVQRKSKACGGGSGWGGWCCLVTKGAEMVQFWRQQVANNFVYTCLYLLMTVSQARLFFPTLLTVYHLNLPPTSYPIFSSSWLTFVQMMPMAASTCFIPRMVLSVGRSWNELLRADDFTAFSPSIINSHQCYCGWITASRTEDAVDDSFQNHDYRCLSLC